MKIFELLRKHFALCGIAISQTSSKTHPFNVKNFTIFTLLCVTVSLTALSLKDASTFDECRNVLFQSVSFGACAILYAIIVLKTGKLFAFISSLSDTIEGSEC